MKYHFQDWMLNSDTQSLYYKKKQVAIRQKAYQLLLYFLQHPNQVIDKQTLFDHLWPDTVVSEQSLFQAINKLRVLLAPNKTIVNHPGVGYEWQGKVVALKSRSINWRTLPTPAIFTLAMLVLFASAWVVQSYNKVEIERDPTYYHVIILPITNNTSAPENQWVKWGLMDIMTLGLTQEGFSRVMPTNNMLALMANYQEQEVELTDLERGFTHIVKGELNQIPNSDQLELLLTIKGFDQEYQQTFVDRNLQNLASSAVSWIDYVTSFRPYFFELTDPTSQSPEFMTALNAFRFSQFEKARISFEQAIEKNQGGYSAKRIYARTLFELGEREQAIDYLAEDMLSQTRPSDKMRHKITLADLHVRDDKYDMAALFLNGVIEQAKREADLEIIAEAYFQLGKLYDGQEMYNQSRVAFERALGLYNVLKFKTAQEATLINLANVTQKSGLVRISDEYLNSARMSQRLPLFDWPHMAIEYEQYASNLKEDNLEQFQKLLEERSERP